MSENTTHNTIVTQAVPGISSGTWPSINSVHFSGMTDYFVNQVHKLDSCNSLQWIIDTGATDHVTPFLHLLVDTKSCNATLQLPNGETAQITHVGKLCLSPNITLTDVLCVPTFAYNLMSISKLVQGTTSQVNFVDGQFYLQTSVMQEKLLLGTAINGLYIFEAPSPGCHMVSKRTDDVSLVAHVSNGNIWHSRMGHAPASILKLLPVTYKGDLLGECDTCCRAKQS